MVVFFCFFVFLVVNVDKLIHLASLVPRPPPQLFVACSAKSDAKKKKVVV